MYSFCCIYTLGFKEGAEVVHESSRRVPVLGKNKLTYASLNDCLGVLQKSWPLWTEVYRLSIINDEHYFHNCKRVSNIILGRKLDIYLVMPGEPAGTSPLWLQWLRNTPFSYCPTFVCVFMSPKTLHDEKGTGSRLLQKTLTHMGYSTATYFCNSCTFGSTVEYSTCIFFFSQIGNLPVSLDETFGGGNREVRGMKPDLVPYPLVNKQYKIAQTPDYVSDQSPMPNKISTIIKTDGMCRYLTITDLARAKGFWKKFQSPKGSNHEWERVPPLHILASVGDLCVFLSNGDNHPGLPPELPHVLQTTSAPPKYDPWVFSMPCLEIGSPWYKARVRNLRNAISDMQDRKRLLREGMQALERHRSNYGPGGPKYLQLLWWEWPRRIWPNLINGFSMHFDTPPPPHQPKNVNKGIPPRELKAMIEYFDQLISMGVLIKGKSKVAGSVFTVEKPELDEHGEHLLRVISNLKEGGSNSYMMPDPVHLERSDDVLYRLYKGGWSMKVDGSKWFHNFPTCTEEQQYLGAIHPGTGKFYVYAGLAMGASSSPAEAGKGEKCFGNTVIEELGHDYQGFVNHPLNLAMNQPYKPELGMGIVYKTRKGVFRPILKSHVDDFFYMQKNINN